MLSLFRGKKVNNWRKKMNIRDIIGRVRSGETQEDLVGILKGNKEAPKIPTIRLDEFGQRYLEGYPDQNEIFAISEVDTGKGKLNVSYWVKRDENEFIFVTQLGGDPQVATQYRGSAQEGVEAHLANVAKYRERYRL